MRFLAEVVVTLKPGVLDPQGQTVERSLGHLGFRGVAGVRVGKYFSFEIDAVSEPEAQAHVTEMARKLLANPVMEQFRVTISERQTPERPHYA